MVGLRRRRLSTPVSPVESKKMAEATFTMQDFSLGQLWKISVRARPLILRSWQSYMLRETRRRYRQMVSPDGVQWPKTKHPGKRHVRTLYATGTLFRSIVPFTVDELTVGIGTNIPYAKRHQEGGKNMPQRKFLGFADADVTAMQDLAVKAIEIS